MAGDVSPGPDPGHPEVTPISTDSTSGAADDRAGSWIPAWRVAGLIFIAYPVVRIILRPPDPVVAALALAATAIFAVMIWSVARRDPDDDRRRSLVLAALDVVLLVIVAVLVLISPDQGWVALFYYASSAASLHPPGASSHRPDRPRRGRRGGEHRADRRDRERSHPGALGVDHRDHDLRDGSPAPNERQALRGARGARCAGRRRGARSDRPRPPRRPRAQPVGDRDQERARGTTPPRAIRNELGRRSPTSNGSPASPWRPSARPSVAFVSRRWNANSKTRASCWSRRAFAPRSRTARDPSRQPTMLCSPGRYARR